ncbi:quaternary amine ABC transporter ATP-binding protein [Brevibacillus invocatus]|uniref:quaternary amine ABC transporter ATP-binding protein n=1 Tax=Brevibacillus invocatus TaxID=173959 RepID=UPI00203EC1FD|nr:glycine betaine/L-proline ABC transporter ATP-binding protein [Brevibacillus invocatus]MCM3079341.1 glycine betaine/L-proline ABC transporter ATP-binding protein [Brevibacillus invocatus]MCM3429437.1 glycine betaine/L-proline ABC transporter ATP-binding protein [Brevibacillus invocatus]
MPKIQVRQLSKVFGRQPQLALKLLAEGWTKEQIFRQTGLSVGVNQVSFDVEEGEIFVIMGLSGSGKSTLVRLCNRLIEPTSGTIFIDGEEIIGMNATQLREVRRKKLGMVFQNFALFPQRTVRENVEFGLEIQHVPVDARQEKAREAIALVGLEEWENAYPVQLSGGMRQRVGLARALANNPDVLLMDEAFSALDPLIRKDMQDELLELQMTMKKTILFITHDLHEALRLGDRIALMRDGQLIQVGRPEEIMTDPADEFVKKFVEDADLSRVLVAKNVMKRAEAITPDKGARVALQLMMDNGVSSLYIVDKKRSLLGLVSAYDVSLAISTGETLSTIMKTDIPTVSPDTLLHDLFPMMADVHVPIAVVGEQQRLLGVLVKGAVLGGLVGKVNISDERIERLRVEVKSDGLRA